jgi:hypothetical protein
MWCILFIEFVRKAGDLLNGSSYTEPGIGLRCGSVVLPVHSKVSIVLTLNQPVISLVAVSSPWLHREWLVLIIIMS